MFRPGRRIIGRLMSGADPSLPTPSLASPLLDRLLGHPAGRAMVRDQGRCVCTYGQLDGASAQVARLLLDGRASLAGARVAMLVPASPDFIAALVGIWRAGGVAVPLSAAHPTPELEHVLRTATPEATIVADDLSAKLAGVTGIGRRLAAPDVTATASGDPVAADVTATSPALMLFTSGTTGKPKGVVLSHAGVAATLRSLHAAWAWHDQDRLLHALPLYHTHGLIVALLGALWAGASLEFRGGAFDAAEIWRAFEHATVFMAVPTMYVKLTDAFAAAPATDRARWSEHARALRLATSGSAALPAALLQRFADATGQTLLERYGMTEIGMALSNPYAGPRIAGTVGVPLPEVTVDIVDEHGAPVPDGTAGELRVRSPQLFLGYHGDPAATAASYDERGRFRTGDTGLRDERGHVRLLGRTSVDILKSGGEKLSALEIEAALAEHPAVAELAVIGVPDPVWGDCVTACAVLRAGQSLTLEALRAWARDRLAPYKLPRALRVLPSLPRNPMGKVQKNELQKLLSGGGASP
jgi:malonyl-CoA/methylmalonyl-CoA synthetase